MNQENIRIHLPQSDAMEILLLTRRIRYLYLKNFRWTSKETMEKYFDVSTGATFTDELKAVYTVYDK